MPAQPADLPVGHGFRKIVLTVKQKEHPVRDALLLARPEGFEPPAP